MAPSGGATRPTADRTRQALFNILEHGVQDFSLDGVRVIDLFAGSGALGLEALSRGAGHCLFIDKDRAALAALNRNIETFNLASKTTVMGCDVRRLPPAQGSGVDHPVDLVFLDPPYGKELIMPGLILLRDRGWLRPGSLCVIEAGVGEKLETISGFDQLDERVYGAARITFLVME